MNLLKIARKSHINGNSGLQDPTGKKINLITVNRPEEDYLKKSIIHMKEEPHPSETQNNVTEGNMKVDDPNTFSQLLRAAKGREM